MCIYYLIKYANIYIYGCVYIYSHPQTDCFCHNVTSSSWDWNQADFTSVKLLTLVILPDSEGIFYGYMRSWVKILQYLDTC